jgi:chromosome segregation ATPase
MSTEAALKRMEEKIDRIQRDVEFIKDDHGKKLDDHGKKLDDHGKKLDDHGKLLEGHEDRFDRLEEAVVTNREMIAENREKIDQVHQAVVLLEKVHSDKLEAVMDGYDIVSNRDYRLEQRLDMTRMCMDDFEKNFTRLEVGQQEIKRTIEQLVSVVSNHEDRLQKIEKKGGS